MNNWLSLGGGANIVCARLDQKTAINNQPTDGAGYPDGRIKVDDDDVGCCFNLGTLIEPTEDMHVVALNLIWRF